MTAALLHLLGLAFSSGALIGMGLLAFLNRRTTSERMSEIASWLRHQGRFYQITEGEEYQWCQRMHEAAAIIDGVRLSARAKNERSARQP
jgi:hypothetical protein